MSRRAFRSLLLGLLAVLVFGEVAARLIESSIPALSTWPTLETQVKGEQLADLGELPEVLIVGSSVTEAGVDPALLVALDGAESAYNSAFPFYSPAAVEVWLNRYVKPWGKSELLIIGLPVWPPPRSAADDPLTAALEAYAEDPPDPGIMDHLALWRVGDALSELDEALSRKRAIDRGLWTPLGHQTFWYNASAESFEALPPFGLPIMPPEHEEALRNIIGAALESGTKPVLVIEPGRYTKPVAEATLEAYLLWLKDFAAELGVPVWDSYSVDWDPALFADGTHLNGAGTAALTEFLADSIRRLDDS